MNVLRSPHRLPLLALALAVLAGSWLHAADEPKKNKPVVAGVSESPDGMMVRRESRETPWITVKEKGELYAGDLVVGLSGARLLSNNKAVQLSLLTDLNGRSPFPIIESAVVLAREPGAFDLDFRLNRGRVDLVNRKEKGSATVQFRVHGDPWEVVLEEPGTRIALELFGRWASGTTFTTTPGPKDIPNAYLMVLVLQGEVQVKHGNRERRLKAPPGPAMVEWDNFSGSDLSPIKLDELPDWALGKQPTELVQKAAVIREKFRQLALNKSIEAALDEFLQSENPLERRLAILAMGALDDLPRLADAMRKAKYPDTWEHAVLALRHWIGRGPGQDMRMYQKMLDKGMSPAHAETIISLLHSFGEDDLKSPETYQLLIGMLDHDVLGIRGLAYWHLSRLVPEGKDFGYDPLGPKEARDAAIQKWRKLIPSGQLPPKPKKDKD